MNDDRQNVPGTMPPMDRGIPTDLCRAAFGLGCFWGPDARLGAIDGVIQTCVGYAGGTMTNPTYEDLGDHIETIQVRYDPDRIHYTELLDHFWRAHDPTRAPFKRQYQPALFPYTDRQRDQARASMADVAAQIEGPVSTELIEFPSFYRAEAYHQKHKLRRHTDLFRVFREMYSAETALTTSPAAALTNGYVGGYRSPGRLDDDAARLGLPADALERLRTVARDRWS